ncbi:hypothetical protein BDFG_09425, partial [Blastomyces dermatitidis ATCC 26199]
SSYIDRSAFISDSEFNVKLLIKNLENVIMKKLFILYIAESSVFSSISSVTSFSAAPSQSSTLVPVSDSPAPATPVLTTLTPATSAPAAAFITSSPCFKKILYRLSEPHFS